MLVKAKKSGTTLCLWKRFEKKKQKVFPKVVVSFHAAKKPTENFVFTKNLAALMENFIAMYMKVFERKSLVQSNLKF